jgi:hypothetical protein
MGYGTAFKYSFMILLFNGLLYFIFNQLFLFIDPSLPETMAQSQYDTSLYWAQKFGAPEATLDQMKEKFSFEEIEERYSHFGAVKGLLFVIIFYALGSSIIAFITRKNKPEDI